MTIIIWKRGKMATEFGRWNKGIVTYTDSDYTEKMSRKEVIHRFNNGYKGTTEIED